MKVAPSVKKARECDLVASIKISECVETNLEALERHRKGKLKAKYILKKNKKINQAKLFELKAKSI